MNEFVLKSVKNSLDTSTGKTRWQVSTDVTSNMPDTLTSGTITALGGSQQIVLGGHKSCTVTILGTWSGTLQVESSTDGGIVWVVCWLQSISAEDTYEILRPVNEIKANGAYAIFNTSGITHYRIIATAWTSGTATVKLTATEAPPSAIFATTNFIQNVLVSANNSSITNIATGAANSFVGKAVSTLGVNAIQVALKTNENCTIYVDQANGLMTGAGTVTTNGTTALVGIGTDFLSRSIGDEIYVSGEGVRTIATIGDDLNLTVTVAFTTSAAGLTYQYYPWDMSDTYNYYASINNFGITTQAVNSFSRTRVKNVGVTTTTYFRLQTCLCPVAEAIPRSLDENGYLKTATKSSSDKYNFDIENTPNGEMRVSEPIRLVGAIFDGATLDTNFWTATVDVTAGPGTVVQGSGELTLNSGTNAAAYSKVNSVRRSRYVSGSSHRYRAVIQLGDTGTANNKRRWGVGYGATMPTITDGAWFQIDGTTFSIVTCKSGTGETVVSSGSFNGTLGNIYTPTTSSIVYEIYWNNSAVWFSINGVLLHKVTASATAWSATLNHYIFMDNVNSAAQGASLTLKCRVASIYRMGKIETAPAWKYYHSAVTAQVLKRGPGRLHKVCFNTIPNTTVITLYDAVTATNPIAIMNPPNGACPYTMHYGLDFYNGLCVTTTPADCDVTIVYE